MSHTILRQFIVSVRIRLLFPMYTIYINTSYTYNIYIINIQTHILYSFYSNNLLILIKNICNFQKLFTQNNYFSIILFLKNSITM